MITDFQFVPLNGEEILVYLLDNYILNMCVLLESLSLLIFKPGVYQLKASALLVSWNYFCLWFLYACVCVSAPEAINN